MMKKKSDLSTALDDMFCDDEKKRINAIRLLKEIAASIGPIRARSELIPFLNEFINEEVPVMLAVLDELDNFGPILGGAEHEKILLPLLLNFCLLDEKDVAMKSLDLIEAILAKNTDLYLDCVKKLAKSEMSVAKQCAAILMSNGAKRMPIQAPTFLEIYKSFVFSDNPAFRIIAAKHLKSFSQNISNKEQICKILDILFNYPEDLPKLLVIDSLLALYPSNSSFVLNKLKVLICIGTWRVLLRIAEFSQQFSNSFSRPHFKTLLEPTFLKMMSSEDCEIRAASCRALQAIAKNLSPDENFSKLYPNVLRLSEDKAEDVKAEFAKNFVKIFPYFAADKVRDSLIPMTIKCLKFSSLEVSKGVLTDFKELSKHLPADKFEENILKPIANQLFAENWRLSVETLGILGTIVVQQNIYTSFIAQTLLKQLKNKIEAVRLKTSQIIISVIKNSQKQWCQSQLIPHLIRLKDQPNYLIKQKVLMIISETVDYVSPGSINVYRKVMAEMMVCNVPNIRMLALKSVTEKKKLLDKNCEALLVKMKDDQDMQVKGFAKEIKI